MADQTTNEHYSVPAILAYLSFAILLMSGLGVFLVVAFKIPVTDVLVGILAGFLATVYGLANQAWGFFLGSSLGAKSANAAMAQIAGAGPPPPAVPMEEKLNDKQP